MIWIVEEFKRGLAQLQRWQTWAGIGLIAFFGLLAYMVGRLALRTDSVLTYLRVTAYACRDFTNGVIIFLFCGMIFFILAAVMTLGEIQNHFQFRQRGASQQARQTLIRGSIWAFVAASIAVAGLLFFKKYCR
ncbi:MAG: hypothetical protein F9K30_14790 [Dechloromonas sp.]|nr:MAG: hypothetical protein F9K30_14790 [Dechloromonas sp.]